MPLTKTYYPPVRLHSFEEVSKVICDALSHTAMMSMTITANDQRVSVTQVFKGTPYEYHVRRYLYEWAAALEEKDAGEDVERLRGDAHERSEGVGAQEALPLQEKEEA